MNRINCLEVAGQQKSATHALGAQSQGHSKSRDTTTDNEASMNKTADKKNEQSEERKKEEKKKKEERTLILYR